MTELGSIQLMVGLGNPGQGYAQTRHNAGAWFIEELATRIGLTLKNETKFHGRVALFNLNGHNCRLLIPTVFMNVSGQSVQAMSQFYQIPPENILIAHDELDFDPGVVKLKRDGGHGGHNGLRDIIQHLHTNDFWRLRLGIGHPGQRDQVHNYVLSCPDKNDKKLIIKEIDHALTILPELMDGDFNKALQKLHTITEELS